MSLTTCFQTAMPATVAICIRFWHDTSMRFTLGYANSIPLPDNWSGVFGDANWRIYSNNAPGMVFRDKSWKLSLLPEQLVLVPAWTSATASCPAGVGHTFLHLTTREADQDWVHRWIPRPRLVPAPLGSRSIPLGHGAMALLQQQILAGEVFAAVLESMPVAARRELDRRVVGHAAVQPALHHIEDHLSEKLPLSRLASISSRGDDRFARLFRSSMGCAPAAYVRRRKCEMAGIHLRQGGRIADVADELGFANRYHFTRVFTRVMGCTPTQWREGP